MKWQSWNSTQFCLYPKPYALNPILFSESVRTPQNCFLQERKVPVNVQVAGGGKSTTCVSWLCATTPKEEKQSSKAKPSNTISAFQWADWELDSWSHQPAYKGSI